VHNRANIDNLAVINSRVSYSDGIAHRWHHEHLISQQRANISVSKGNLERRLGCGGGWGRWARFLQPKIEFLPLALDVKLSGRVKVAHLVLHQDHRYSCSKLKLFLGTE
jgi:hypothetical protein